MVGSSFVNNSGSDSGAIGSLNSELDVYNSTFQGNAALGFGANSDDATMCSVVAMTGQHQVGSGGNGGAIGIDGGSDGNAHILAATRSRPNAGGTGALGGALARTPDNAKQTTVIDRCLFDSNTGDSAGALYFHNSTLTITASTFTGNVGQTGVGTIQADGTTIDFTNVTFYGNHATAGVGATLALFSGDGTMQNCTFADNVCDAANMFAAAIFGSPNLTIQNTIFDANTAQNPGAPMQCQVGTITGGGDMQWPKNHANGGSADALCAPGIYEGGDPMLGPLGDQGGPVPVALVQAGSPALGRGTGCPSTDARGMPRSARAAARRGRRRGRSEVARCNSMQGRAVSRTPDPAPACRVVLTVYSSRSQSGLRSRARARTASHIHGIARPRAGAKRDRRSSSERKKS